MDQYTALSPHYHNTTPPEPPARDRLIADLRRHGIHAFPHQRLRERFMVGGARGDVRCAVDICLFHSVAASSPKFRVDMSIHATFYDLVAFLERRLSSALLQADGGTVLSVCDRAGGLTAPRVSMMWCAGNDACGSSSFGMHLSDILTLKERSMLTHGHGSPPPVDALLSVVLSTGTERREAAVRQTIDALASADWNGIMRRFVDEQYATVVFAAHPHDVEAWYRCCAGSSSNDGNDPVARREECRLLGFMMALLSGCPPDEIQRYDAFVHSDEVDADCAVALWIAFVGRVLASAGHGGVVCIDCVPLDQLLVDAVAPLMWWQALHDAATRFLCVSCGRDDVAWHGGVVGALHMSLARDGEDGTNTAWVDHRRVSVGALAQRSLMEQQSHPDADRPMQAIRLCVSIKPLMTFARARSRCFVDAASNHNESLGHFIELCADAHHAFPKGPCTPLHPLCSALPRAPVWPADVLVALEAAYLCFVRASATTLANGMDAAIRERITAPQQRGAVSANPIPLTATQSQRLWWQWRVASFLGKLGFYCCVPSTASPPEAYDALVAQEVAQLKNTVGLSARGAGECHEVATFLVHLRLSGLLDPHRYPGKEEAMRLRLICVDIRLRWEGNRP